MRTGNVGRWRPPKEQSTTTGDFVYYKLYSPNSQVKMELRVIFISWFGLILVHYCRHVTWESEVRVFFFFSVFQLGLGSQRADLVGSGI